MPAKDPRTHGRRQLLLLPVDWIVEDVSRFLRGWAEHSHYGNSADQVGKINRYARMRRVTVVAERDRRTHRLGWHIVARA